MHCPLSRPLSDGKGGVIFDSELHKEGFMRFMGPDFGIPLCFCLSLGINLNCFLPFLSHLLFLFIPLLIFCFAFIHSTDCFHFSNQVPIYSTVKFSAFKINSMYSQKNEVFCRICVVKEQRYWKDETVLIHTENPNNSHILIALHNCAFGFIEISKAPTLRQNFREIIKCIFSTLEKIASITPVLCFNSWHLGLPSQTVWRSCSCEQIYVSFLHYILLRFSRKTNPRANCLEVAENM